MKKKIISSTLAASLVLGTMAAFPVNAMTTDAALSYAQTVQAAGTLSDWLNAKQQQVHSQLLDSEKTAVAAAQTALKAESTSIIDPIWNTITGLDGITKEQLFSVIQGAGLFILGDTTQAGKFVSGGEYNDLLQAVAAKAGVGSVSDEEIMALINKLETLIKNEITLESIASLPADGLQDVLTAKVKTGLETAVKGTKFEAIANTLNINWTTLSQVKQQMAGSLDTYKPAVKALTLAAVRSQSYLAGKNVTNGTQVTLNVYGLDTPIGYEVYSKYINLELNTAKSPDVSLVDGVVRPMQGRSADAYVTATIPKLGGAVLFQDVKISVSYTASTGGSGGGGGAVVVDILPDYFTLNNATLDEINALKQELASAVSESAKKEAISKLQQLLNEYILKAGTLNISPYTTDKDGKVSFSLNSSALSEQLVEVNKNVKKMIESFTEVYADLNVPAITVTLNVGKTTSGNLDAKLSKDLMELFKTNEVGTIKVPLNGFVTTLAVDALQGDVNWTVGSKKVDMLSNVPVVASAVYDVDFSFNNLTKLPEGAVLVNIPLNADYKLPKHSLQVATIVDGAAKNLKAAGTTYSYALTDAKQSVAITGRDVNFKDAASVEAWAGYQIDFAASLGIIDGVGNNNFAPNTSVKRSEIAKMMVLAFELEGNNTSKSFKDVDSSAWYAEYVALAAENGLLNGFTDGSFKPAQPVDRAQMAAIAARAMKAKYGWTDVENVDEVLKGFKDADAIHPSLRKDVALAVKHNLIMGNNGKLDPNGITSRAQAAVIFYRLLNN